MAHGRILQQLLLQPLPPLPQLPQAPNAALYETVLRLTRWVAITPKSPISLNRTPSFPHARIAALYVIVSPSFVQAQAAALYLMVCRCARPRTESASTASSNCLWPPFLLALTSAL